MFDWKFAHFQLSFNEVMYPNYNYTGVPSGSDGTGQPYYQWIPEYPSMQQQPMVPQMDPSMVPHMVPPMAPPIHQPMVPPGYNEEYAQWAQWNSHIGAMNPTSTWRHQAASTMRHTPYDRPAMIQHQVPYGGRPYVPRDLSGPNAHTMRAPLVQPKLNKQKQSDFFLRNNSSCLIFEVSVSSTMLDITWKRPHVSGKLTYSITVAEDGVDPWALDFPQDCTKHSMRATAGQSYVISVSAVKVSNGTTIAKGEKTIKAVFSELELRQLYDKAVMQTKGNMRPFQVFYRCKPRPYWDDVHHNCGDVMEKYMKDNNGQPANMINGVISGLFFMLRLVQGNNLPESSPFGNVRMIVPAGMLLDPDSTNLYFADFYCYREHSHYVTVIIAKKGSQSDEYCQKHLIALDKWKNPWLKYVAHPEGGFVFYAAHCLWVEVFYTENIPLSWGRFEPVRPVGQGTSTIGGLPNNKTCAVCNLYPQKTSGARVEAIGFEEADEDDTEDTEEKEGEEAANPLISPFLRPVRQQESIELPKLPESPASDKADAVIVEGFEELSTCENQMEGGEKGEKEGERKRENVNGGPQWAEVIECMSDVVEEVVRMEEREREITSVDSTSESIVETAIEEMDSIEEVSEDEKIHALESVVADLEERLLRARQELVVLREARAARALAPPTPQAPPISSSAPTQPMEISDENMGKCLDDVEPTVPEDTVELKEDGEEAAVEAQMEEEATVEAPPPSSPASSQMTESSQESDECMGEEEPTVPVDTIEVKEEEEITVEGKNEDFTVEVQMEQENSVEAPPSSSPAPYQLAVIYPATTDECMDNEEPTVPLDTVELEIAVEDKNEETTVVQMEKEATVDNAIDQDTVVNRSIEEEDEDLEEDTVALKLSTTAEPSLIEEVKFSSKIDSEMKDLTEEELLLFGSGSCGLIEISPEMEEELLRDCY